MKAPRACRVSGLFPISTSFRFPPLPPLWSPGAGRRPRGVVVKHMGPGVRPSEFDFQLFLLTE